ncbi:hypothetical protein KC343_g2571 [Hortaea werneckii]|uniref:RNA polymerase II subunit B1 CTD phosphatase RPAP2 homolog n=1 Tax=Hortaea werneckii TaxID=91943 RepID=A0A3M7FFU0_HORWE|nr:hypothetical protein KC352_g14250 [Hortaea werneckii]KAI7572084.1 hypothetical protein KC317_g1073 [Hortaea werneckii]KAI7626492.1 hypothetical protein KC346_g1242 [Hortaea werneckii]KAI7634137.1 hypothetical protein KC343_g2571 [Hortaea werneckii]KAI7682089.1 hypothetical protein KC319_g1204 [Hortaea werneckii]
MSTKVPVKSILKQQSSNGSNATDEQQTKAQKDRDNLKLALKHANLIQHQKEVQALILRCIETLLDFPPSPPTAEQQTAASQFRDAVTLFQPGDYDDLIEERRIDARCGYALCKREPRISTVGDSASWKFSKGAADYCSNSCWKKSLHVKTQLSEVPVWERDPRVPVIVKLPDEDEPQPSHGPEKGVRQTQRAGPVIAGPVEQEELALERGEKVASFRPAQVMQDRIVEKRETVFRPLSSLDQAQISSTSIEGYEPKRKGQDGDASDNDSDDDDGE